MRRVWAWILADINGEHVKSGPKRPARSTPLTRLLGRIPTFGLVFILVLGTFGIFSDLFFHETEMIKYSAIYVGMSLEVFAGTTILRRSGRPTRVTSNRHRRSA